MFASLAQVGPDPTAATPPGVAVGAPAPVSTTTATSQPAGPDAKQEKGPFGQYGSMVTMGLLLVMVYLFMFRGQRKDEKNRKKMLEQLKRGDRVMTIGGLYGSVVEIKGDDVILKVDEANNIKERYVRSAIQKVLEEEKPAESESR